MIETLEPSITTTPEQIVETTGTCKICRKAMHIISSRMPSDETQLVCGSCRCTRCRIVLSRFVCPCGSLHGTPSRVETLCARCYDQCQDTVHVTATQYLNDAEEPEYDVTDPDSLIGDDDQNHESELGDLFFEFQETDVLLNLASS